MLVPCNGGCNISQPHVKTSTNTSGGIADTIILSTYADAVHDNVDPSTPQGVGSSTNDLISLTNISKSDKVFVKIDDHQEEKLRCHQKNSNHMGNEPPKDTWGLCQR